MTGHIRFPNKSQDSESVFFPPPKSNCVSEENFKISRSQKKKSLDDKLRILSQADCGVGQDKLC